MPTTSSKQAAANLRAAVEAGKAGATRALPAIGEQIRLAVVASLASPAAPAPPGAPPARREARLIASYRTEVGRGRVGPSVAVFSTSHIARFQEYGTSKQEPRPHLRPAVERARPTIPGQVAAGWAAGQRSRTTRAPRGA